MNSHVSHAAAGIVGGVAAAALLALATHLMTPTPVGRPSAAPSLWSIDAPATIAAIKPLKLKYIEFVCGAPACAEVADALATEAGKQGIDADVSAPIGRVPAGLIVSGGKAPDPAKVAIAINKATGSRLPISFLRWPFYKAGTVTISFGRLK